MWYIWLIAAGIFFIAEMITVGFLIFWLGVSALLAMCTSFITDNLFIQTAVFVVSSCILIPFTKPLISNFVTKDDGVKTNAFSFIDKQGVVVSTISSNENGQVKVKGELWSATCEENITINVGEKVKVLKIDGVKLIVEPIFASQTQK